MTDFFLKDIYNKQFLKTFNNLMLKVFPEFDAKAFTKKVFDKDWEARELKERMRHITVLLQEFLPSNYKRATSILKKLTKELQKANTDDREDLSFPCMFLPDFVEQYGLDDYDTSIKAIEAITQFTSAEFAVRPFIKKYPDKMMAQMLAWADHKNEWVRRLASEGSRPRLPWGMALGDFKKDPTPVLPILEKLKNDSSETVRRSVANNLNDISKDNPELVLKIGKKWIGKTPEMDWVVKHASRTLLKQGNTDAMLLFGFGDPKNVTIADLAIVPNTIKIGDKAEFSFTISIKGKKDLKLRLEYAIYFVKANGSLSKKVFQISERVFQAGSTETIRKQQHFKQLSTRKHYPGTHQLGVSVNGRELERIEFDLIQD